MSRKDHGFNLQQPMLQPKTSRFRQTSAGFDTGSREFIVDSDYYESVRPARDTPDTKVTWRDATGATITGRYARMFVDEVDVVEETNGLTRYTVSYLGMLGISKPGDITKDTELGQYRVRSKRTLNGPGSFSFNAFESTPTVTHVYLSLVEPDLSEVGSRMNPPSSGASSLKSRPYISGITSGTSGTEILFQGWTLRSRSDRQRGTIWEVRDVYSYERVRKQ